MKTFTYDNGGQVDVGSENDQVVLYQTHQGVDQRGPARLTPEEALELADGLTAAAEAAETWQPAPEAAAAAGEAQPAPEAPAAASAAGFSDAQKAEIAAIVAATISGQHEAG